MKDYLEFAKDIAMFAKDEMLKHYNYDISLNFKLDKSVVTVVDKEINRYLIDKVKEVYPTHSVNGEEENYNLGSEYAWVCDPLDGTGMYVNHVPVFVFSLALVHNGEPIVGVVYNPIEERMYSAIKGEGAYVNDVKIIVNDKHLGALGYKTDIEIFKNNIIDEVLMMKELKDVSKVSAIGSVARACMAVATGDFSCVIFPGTEHGNCDIAASKLIVTEAGGRVTNLYNEEQRYDKDIMGGIISNGISHDEIYEIVRKYVTQKDTFEKQKLLEKTI